VAERVNDGPPCSVELGEMEVSVGAGLSTVKVDGADDPPPGAGFVTVTLNVPVDAMSAALMVAVTFVEFTNVVARGEPAQSTTEVLTKSLPFTVNVKVEPPTMALLGNKDVMDGFRFFTAKGSEPEVPPPGEGLVAVIGKVPPVLRSAAVIDAVNSEEVLKAVVRGDPFQFTVAPLTKLDPFTVRVKAADPTFLLVGVSDVRDGTGLPIENANAFDAPPPGVGFETLTFAVPAVAISDALIAAVTCVELTNVVVREEPFQSTLDPLTKFVPFTVKVNAGPPACAPVGDRETAVGSGLSIVKGSELEVCPPLKTVTAAVPAVSKSLAGTVAVSWLLLTKVVARLDPFH